MDASPVYVRSVLFFMFRKKVLLIENKTKLKQDGYILFLNVKYFNLIFS